MSKAKTVVIDNLKDFFELEEKAAKNKKPTGKLRTVSEIVEKLNPIVKENFGKIDVEYTERHAFINIVGAGFEFHKESLATLIEVLQMTDEFETTVHYNEEDAKVTFIVTDVFDIPGFPKY